MNANFGIKSYTIIVMRELGKITNVTLKKIILDILHIVIMVCITYINPIKIYLNFFKYVRKMKVYK